MHSVGVVGGFTALSRGLGLVRDIFMAAFFGTSMHMSAFVVAFTIPNLFRRFFGEGALSSSFIPVFVESRKNEGDQRAWAFAQKITTFTTVTLSAIVFIGIVIITIVLATDLDEKTALTFSLLRIMLPYMVFICLVALAMGMLNSHHHFATSAITPCVLNLFWISTILFICPHVGSSMDLQIRAVAWGILAAGIFQLGMQVPVLYRFGYRHRWSFDFKDQRVRQMLALMGPAAMGMAVTQINVLIDRLLAAWIGDWAPAALFYSERLVYLPLGLFTTAFSTVLLPVFSRQVISGKKEAFVQTFSHGLRNLLFIMIPAAIGLFVLARPIVEMIFQGFEFTERSAELTAVALRFYAPGLVVFSLSKILVTAFYAQKDMCTPVKIGMITVGVNIVLNLLFIIILPLPLKHAGIAFATVLAEAGYAMALCMIMVRRGFSPGWGSVGKTCIRCLTGAFLMGWLAVVLNKTLFDICLAQNMVWKMAQIISVVGSIMMAILFYLFFSMLIRSADLKSIWVTIRPTKEISKSN